MSLQNTSLFLNGITLEDFENIIKNAVRKEMLPHLQKITAHSDSKPEELLSKKEAGIFLKMSLPTLSKLVKEGAIPCSRIGGSIRFKKSHLEKALEPVRNKNYSIPLKAGS